MKPEEKYFKDNNNVLRKTASTNNSLGAGKKIGSPSKVVIKEIEGKQNRGKTYG